MHRKPAQDFFLFLLGGGLFGGGIFLLLNQVMVASAGGWFGRWGGGLRQGLSYGMGGGWGDPALGGSLGGMGLLMIPLGIGMATLLINGDRKLAWLLIWGSSSALVAGLLHTLDMRFMPTTLWTLAMIVIMVGGGGSLIFKALYGNNDADQP